MRYLFTHGIAVFFFLICALTQNICAQDPASREDAAIERAKILKAADNIDRILAEMETVQVEIKNLREELATLKNENNTLKQALAQAETKQQQERELLLQQVSETIAKINKPAPPPAATATTSTPANAQPAANVGYEHIVQKGQTLWLIAKAYREQGVDVSTEDIQQANNLGNSTSIKEGQKLFIPGN